MARYDCRWQESVEEGDIGLPVDHLDEGESNTSTKPPVGHDELLLQVDLLQTEPEKIRTCDWLENCSHLLAMKVKM